MIKMRKLHKIAALTSSAFILAYQASLMTLTLNTPLCSFRQHYQLPPGEEDAGSGTVNKDDCSRSP